MLMQKLLNEASEILDALVRQLNNPVQWTRAVSQMADMGVTHQLEIGPWQCINRPCKKN